MLIINFINDLISCYGKGSIEAKLRRILEDNGIYDKAVEIDLITTARYFHYVFNPVSFYYCYREDQSRKVRA